ncbi:MAG: DNA repair protein RecN [Rhodospirillales bacterium]|jgi:DNA repair protein RecN (Recombination protein N)|nr:DNA repair protein RecN [Rhodospirillales bacterium]HJO96386.1 DNA repair protein RecN [Rhodospirillales bacterium]
MLRRLTIHDVVLIERLELDFHSRLSVLTGETGAGKSILLDALGLALGARADSALVRHGADQAVVVAEFEIADDHPAHHIIAEQGLGDDEETLLLRRVLGADGRSRAYLNDQPVSVALQRQIGETLVGVHGQFENQRLLEPAAHRGLLDAHGSLTRLLTRTGETFGSWRRAAAASTEAEATLVAARRDEAFLRHAADEISTLDPQPGEEAELAEKRTVMMHGEKLLEAMNEAAADLNEGQGAETMLRAAQRHLERVAPLAEGRLEGAIAALDRAAVEAGEGVQQLEKISAEVDLDPRHLEQVEEHLFALRALARKHDVATDDLAELGIRLATRLASIEDGGADLKRLQAAEAAARVDYVKAATALSEARRKAAARLDAAVAGELEPLRLGAAVFTTQVELLAEDEWGEAGSDRVAFRVSTNPGAPEGPLARISSGGEVARFMLALKVVLARADPVPTIIFDEVDHGVGGAVAAAIGLRLARLAEDFQVLVVTHSPQVAARGAHHWQVSKATAKAGVLTSVDALSETARREEIARMLSGTRITDEARSAADRLLQGQSK